MKTKVNRVKHYWPYIVVVVLLIGYWFLPIEGAVILYGGDTQQEIWPRFNLQSQSSISGNTAEIIVNDVEPWSYVELLVNNKRAEPMGSPVRNGNIWTWRWSYKVPEEESYHVAFYINCHLGCEERGSITVGQPSGNATKQLIPTKLGVVLPNPDRDWHGRSGWAVEITYATMAEEPYWGVDDLALRISHHREMGLRVLVRVDYDQVQSIPPTDDNVALAEYLAYFNRLAEDDRLMSVYGYIVGNDYNTLDAVGLSPGQPVTPEWYARIFSGYGENPEHTDNVIQTVRNVNQYVRLITGPIRPWSTDADGHIKHATNMPWLNYMTTLTAYLHETYEKKSEIGVPFCIPDGFDIQAPGLPDAEEMAGYGRWEEPAVEHRRESWNGARVGFQVYKDWLDIINAYPSTRGLPVYIVSTNTYDRANSIPPAQNYPQGWLTTALETVMKEPQIHALCWFLDDFPHSDQWDWFSLTQQSGRLVDAAEEFDALLQLP
jgi:hypothetical protein